jgi:DNA-directed RNA polymerase subunit M/transcription elongation factor TFIIS
MSDPRGKIFDKFYEILSELNKFDDDKIEYIAAELEKVCYNSVINICMYSKLAPQRSWRNTYFVETYSTKCASVMSLISKNSDTAKNYPKFHKKFIKKLSDIDNFDFIKLAESDFAVICEESIQKEQDEINIRRAQKVKIATSTMFKCPQCKKNNCSYETVQIRSLDEASDYKCTCFECGNIFRGS